MVNPLQKVNAQSAALECIELEQHLHNVPFLRESSAKALKIPFARGGFF